MITRFALATAVLAAMIVLGMGAALHAGTPFKWKTVGTETTPRVDSPGIFVMQDSNMIGIFGGFSEAVDISGVTTPMVNTFFNDIYLFDADAETWTRQTVASGPKPAPRALGCSVYHEPSGDLYIFGGSDFPADFAGPFIYYDDLWKFDFDTGTWTELSVQAPKPSGRAVFGCDIVGDSIYIFGGIGSDFTPNNELWRFDIPSGTWTLVQENDPDPVGRPGTRNQVKFSHIPGTNQLLLAGGESFDLIPDPPFVVENTREDVWVYTIDTDSWEELDVRKKPEIPRLNEAFAMTSARYFFTQNGDKQGDLTVEDTCLSPLVCLIPTTPTNDTLVYDLAKEKWRSLKATGKNLLPTRRSVMAKLGDTLYLVGGYDWDGTSGAASLGKIPNEATWKLRLKDKYLDDEAEEEESTPAVVGDSWEELAVDPTGDNPFPLDTFAVCTTKKDGGFIFGGGEDLVNFPVGDSQGNFAIFTNELYSWKVLEDPVRIKFEKLPAPAGQPAPSRRGFPEITCTKKTVYLYGGVDNQFNTVDDPFWKYDVDSGQWTALPSIPVSPDPAAAPGQLNGVTMQLWKGTITLFGGVFADLNTFTFTSVNDIWEYDIADQTWTNVPLPGTPDDPKEKHIVRSSLVEDGDTRMLLYGGEQAFPFPIDNELHLLNLKSGEITKRASGPLQNYEAFACNENRCILAGGDIAGSLCGDSQQKVTNATHLYEVESDTWQLLELDNMPAPSKRSRGVWVDGYFYKFGGFDIGCFSDPETGEIVSKPIREEKLYRLRLDED